MFKHKYQCPQTLSSLGMHSNEYISRYQHYQEPTDTNEWVTIVPPPPTVSLTTRLLLTAHILNLIIKQSSGIKHNTV